MRDSLLWVYEGQTQYWGFVLAARAGLLTKQEGAGCHRRHRRRPMPTIRGRRWRPLEDTTNDPIIAQRRPLPWRSCQRQRGLLLAKAS